MAPSVIKTCEICGKEFKVIHAKILEGKGKYCSNTCRHIGKRNRQECHCVVCGISFLIHPSDIALGRGKYCSNECRYIGLQKRIEGECLICKKKLIWSLSRQGLYCSYECVMKGRANFRHLHAKAYRGPNWNTQKLAVLKRDNNTCQYCHHKQQVDEPRLSVHHIKPFREFHGDWENANQLNNLITLCASCHVRAETGKINLNLPY